MRGKLWLGVAVSVALLWVAFRGVDAGEIVQKLRQVRTVWLLPVILSIFSYLFYHHHNHNYIAHPYIPQLFIHQASSRYCLADVFPPLPSHVHLGFLPPTSSRPLYPLHPTRRHVQPPRPHLR